MNRLPIEIVTQILCYLPFDDQVSASVTCSLWEHILNSRKFRKARYGTDIEEDPEEYEESVEFSVLHKFFNTTSAFLCSVEGEKVTKIAYVKNIDHTFFKMHQFWSTAAEESETDESDSGATKCSPKAITITKSRILDESAMVVIETDEGIPDDSDSDGSDTSEGYTCYCDNCEIYARRDTYSRARAYMDKDGRGYYATGRGCGDIDFRPHKSVRDLIEEGVRLASDSWRFSRPDRSEKPFVFDLHMTYTGHELSIYLHKDDIREFVDIVREC
ncbi:hypothetical protein TWF281_000581 [Arthrobotrys megalospora]